MTSSIEATSVALFEAGGLEGAGAAVEAAACLAAELFGSGFAVWAAGAFSVAAAGAAAVRLGLLGRAGRAGRAAAAFVSCAREPSCWALRNLSAAGSSTLDECERATTPRFARAAMTSLLDSFSSSASS